MKKPAYIFVDDGSPEASDYDNNYVCYDPEMPGSYEEALEEARRRLSIAATPATRLGCRSSWASAEVTPRPTSRSPPAGVNREVKAVFWSGILNALKHVCT